MQERLQLFIQQKNLLPKYQAGFRKGRSVTDHVVRLGENTRRALARKWSSCRASSTLHELSTLSGTASSSTSSSRRAYYRACPDSSRPFSLVVPWPFDGKIPSNQRGRLTLECHRDPSSSLCSSPLCSKTWVGVLPLWHCIRRDACKYLFNSALPAPSVRIY